MNFSSPIRRRTASAALLALAAGRVLASCQRYYLASTAYAQSRADVLNRVFLALQKAGQWVKANPREAATLLSTAWGLDAATIEQANSRRSYQVRAVAPTALLEQQRIADTFFAEKLLPKRISAQDVALFRPGA
jgi:sulfonate transport system substrate-binding protein